ncbi:MAG: hypothetical protein KC420_23250, partial [Myxococcales bacterium]|nr:hypothetical protein [Myxococcales bacterium]
MDPTVRETHSAVLALVGDRAYKVKKPVRLPFLDFSTVAARRTAVEREVALNRRLAPDVYLGVGEWRAADRDTPGPGEPVLVMRRMPDDRRLTTLVTGPARDPDALHDAVRAVARTVASFHSRAERSPAIDAAGDPATIAAKFSTDVRES